MFHGTRRTLSGGAGGSKGRAGERESKRERGERREMALHVVVHEKSGRRSVQSICGGSAAYDPWLGAQRGTSAWNPITLIAWRGETEQGTHHSPPLSPLLLLSRFLFNPDDLLIEERAGGGKFELSAPAKLPKFCSLCARPPKVESRRLPTLVNIA